MVDFELMRKERNEAPFSFDKQQILEYLRKYQIPAPSDDRIFWKGIYMCILNIGVAPDAVKAEARARLAALGGGNGVIN